MNDTLTGLLVLIFTLLITGGIAFRTAVKKKRLLCQNYHNKKK